MPRYAGIIQGRRYEPRFKIRPTRFSDDPDTLFETYGGELRTFTSSNQPGHAELRVRHENATDEEHDSANLAMFVFDGLQFAHMMYGTLTFTGVLMEARWYDEGTDIMALELSRGCTSYVCDDVRFHTKPANAKHLIMPYMPPERKIRPIAVEITCNFNHIIPEEGDTDE